MFGPRAKHVPVNLSTLRGLVQRAYGPKAVLDFNACFPGLQSFSEKVLRSSMLEGKFDNFLCTDGVSVSVLFSFKRAADDDTESVKKVFRPGRGLVRVEGVDMKAAVKPKEPQEGQHMIGVDPGKRDLIYFYNSTTRQEGHLSVARHRHESGEQKAWYLTRQELYKKMRHGRLLRRLQALPERRVPDSEDFAGYARA
eukprot:scaffold5041_cov197-Pinguiococcus_pyrenoidosus.AAC.2